MMMTESRETLSSIDTSYKMVKEEEDEKKRWEKCFDYTMKSGEKKLKQSRPPLFIDDQSDWPDLSDLLLLLLFHGPAKRFDILTKQEKLSQVQEGKQLGDWYAVSSQKKLWSCDV